MPVAQIDDQELFDFIADHGVKNFDNFRVRSSLLKLSKKYEALKAKEPVVAYTYLGIIEAYKNNYDLSIDLLNKALKLSPFERVVMQNLAKSYEQKGDYKKAFETYLTALKHTAFDKEIFENTLLLAQFFCDVDILNELKNINSECFAQLSNSNLKQIYVLHKFLTDRNFDFENYRIQLSCAYKVIHKHMNIHQSAIERYFNYEGNYLSNVLEVDHSTVDLLDTINTEFDDEIFKVASAQPDGGFEFYEKLSQSNLTFNFLNPERDIA